MGELDEMDFGPDTDAIRRWLAKRATYAGDLGDPVRGGKHRVDPPSMVDPEQLSVPSARDAGKHVLDALVAPEPPVAARWPEPYQPTAKPLEPKSDGSIPAPPPKPGQTHGGRSPYASTPEQEEELTASRSTNRVFKPRRLVRTTVSVVFLVVAAVTAYTGYLATQERTTASYGIVVLFGLLALLIWGVRASISITEMAVIHGQLELIRNGRFEVVDLASPYTPVLVEGKPGRRWKVFIERHDEPLLVIDASMVDPEEFMTVLHRVRPDLRPDGGSAGSPDKTAAAS